MLKVLICGTHPVQTNGYSRVVFELARHIEAGSDSVTVSVFGFQRHASPAAGLEDERALPHVAVYDAAFNETPKAAGFGFTEFRHFVACSRPDVVLVLNDMCVLCGMIAQLKDMPERQSFKVIAYIDQVYMSQRREFVNFVNQHADAAIAFTPYWRANLRKIGVTLPAYFLRHGFNTMKNFPVPQALARMFFGFSTEDFLVLNLNRNQPRKRWDKCMQTLAEVIAREPGSRIRMVVATELCGGHDIMDVYERELGKWGISMLTGMGHLLVLRSPQGMSDGDVNALYNAVDIGINTCDGEGFGLCNFENAAVGVPQVVPALGGFLDFFDASCSIMVQPRTTFYLDASKDGVGGEAQMCDQTDFAQAVLAYHADPELRSRHGAEARRRITTGATYAWPDIASRMCCIATEVAGDHVNIHTLDISRPQVDNLVARDGTLSI